MAKTNNPSSGTSSQLTKKAASSSLGAPAQRNQSSRKGKRAWRKNVDLDEVEEGLEELRSEERATGTTLQKKKNEELFQVDVTGDDEVRKTLPKFSERVLTSTKILSQRSAVPAVFSRTTDSAAKAGAKRKAVTHDEKTRLLKMGKRLRRGPFDAFVDPDQVGEGSATLELSEAAKKAGTYDVWAEEVPEKIAVKAPQSQHPRSMIALAAVPSPHEGTSYNPSVVAHQELLRTAHQVEEQKWKGVDELEATKAKIEKARAIAAAEAATASVVGTAPGMNIDEPGEAEAEEEDASAEPLPPKKMPGRKTKQQRKKAERLRAERLALAEKAARKRMLASVDSAKALRKALSRNLATRERLREQQQLAEQKKLKEGLAGQKIGKHKVPEGNIDVQLGEELSESLRGLKPEGNLFKDRFISMQQRALIEPRTPVLTRTRRKTKEYEKHSYKRFDREY
ncbi:P60-like protein [Lentinus tigrinus ALCF2SS1-7]|uniref:Ribosome biogenesis protein NOP53 n=1 Tax=Lentinus tigrinus ALCF2SS1-6 TaxID=1328759 RepID=A0A5C2SJG7_9APHY|nr:P60-like protein [Lentinus tigrinus ALCF2SS1-6]RPD76170.1 P60-like protein [Lentinus tigrinus ALCF2SS1-7]